MKQGTDELSMLLNLDDLYTLYTKIGESINNDIDLNNSGYSFIPRRNSFCLLKKCEFIAEEDGIFYKKRIFNNLDAFSTALLKEIKVVYVEDIDGILSTDKRYDEESNLFYIPFNSIDFNKAGLIMLLSELNYFKKQERYIYLLDEQRLKTYSRKDSLTAKKQITLIELKDNLVLREQLGENGETKALEYEKSLLMKQNIQKEPKIISGIDVGAGYDMVSYLSTNSQEFDKFIEVKNCKDMNLRFYITINEINAAREKGDSYFLYLYIRSSDQIISVRNPYQHIIESNGWVKESQIYKIHKMF